jgi:C4-dicarboxylate-specific signal transduction histidine kinase
MINILIVDDMSHNIMLIKTILKSKFHNIEIYEASDGIKALNVIQNHKIDIVLSDIEMPNMDGIELLRECKKSYKDIEFIVVSSHSDTQYFLDTIKMGVDGYILRPLDIEQLKNTVSKSIEKIDMKNELIQYQTDLESKIESRTKQLQDQSRFAAMGEMISMIAHQWRQPLSSINGIVAPLDIKCKMGMDIDPKDATHRFAQQNEIVQYLSSTIDDFLGFFKDRGDSTYTTLNELIMKPNSLMSAGFKETGVVHNITFNTNKDTELLIKSSKFDQVMMNIYKNALDEFKEKNQENKVLNTLVARHNDDIIIEVSDNAGGIPEDILPNIWDAYFSTKSVNGTGIGLYMSKMLVEQHLNGTIKAFNKDDGVVFCITLSIK